MEVRGIRTKMGEEGVFGAGVQKIFFSSIFDMFFHNTRLKLTILRSMSYNGGMSHVSTQNPYGGGNPYESGGNPGRNVRPAIRK